MELTQYIRMIRRKWWLVLAVVIVACAASGIKSYFFTVPIYEASAKLIVNQSSPIEGENFPDIGLLQTNLMLIDSYKEIISSSAILDQVTVQYPQLDDTSYEMGQTLSVYSTNNSQVMNLTYWSTSFDNAAATVNAIAKVFKEQIPLIMNVDNITILSEAKMDNSVPQEPININLTMSILIAFVISLMLAIGLVLLLYYMDDTLKSEDELKELLGIPLLAAIGKISREDMRSKNSIATTHKHEVGEGKYASVNQ
ncbi:MAG: YveK family protein [Candidatus Pristimantibacillus sp.]